jgi:3-isopropylmalate dehydrogenase
VHKTNVLVHAGQLWSGSWSEVSLEYPEVSVTYTHIDAAIIYLVTTPAAST